MYIFESFMRLVSNWRCLFHKFLSSLNIFKSFRSGEKHEGESGLLFKGAKTCYINLKATNERVKSCAVDDFDLGYDQGTNNSNPFNWDLNSLVIDNNNLHNHSAKSATNNVNNSSTSNGNKTKSKTPDNKKFIPFTIFSDVEEDAISEDEEDATVFPLDDEMNLFFVHTLSSLQLPPQAKNNIFTNELPKNISIVAADNQEGPQQKQRKLEQEIADYDPSNSNRKRLRRSKKQIQTNNENLSLASTSSPAQTSSPHGFGSPSPTISGNGTKSYTCSICDAQFNVKAYLTRHEKKHATEKPFHCPYYDSNSPTKCHSTGGFSRRDTFKTHLKAIHFVYPTGTRCGERVDKKGRCAGCFQEFDSNQTWLTEHVEANKCKSMISECR